ncbi:MAG: hypothetical protein KGZ53_09415 [Peptococcaceae bacterium]|nr:hypothetical protein [Peptococcaceae bacterium]
MIPQSMPFSTLTCNIVSDERIKSLDVLFEQRQRLVTFRDALKEPTRRLSPEDVVVVGQTTIEVPGT